MTTPKEKLYRTAFSPLFDCFVSIDHSWQDDRGEWIFKCLNKSEGLVGHLFRTCELTKFCL